MDLPNFKELEKLLKLCRKQGITELAMQGMSFKFGDLPLEPGAKVEEQVPNSPSEEDMMFWSSQPDPLAERQAQ